MRLQLSFLNGIISRINKRSSDSQPDSQLRRHQPHQAPGQRVFKRLAVEILLLWGMQRHDPAGVVDGPGALAAAGGDDSQERILQGAFFSPRSDAGLSHGAGALGGASVARRGDQLRSSAATVHPR
jgi:hypothetical protein